MNALPVTATRIFDGCVFHEWPSTAALLPYMDAGWRESLGRPRTFVKSPHLYPDPWGSKDPLAVPAEGPAGSDFELLKSQILDDGLRARVVLGFDDGLLSTVFPNYHVARVVAQAANDWTAEQWLSRDDRLHGLILVSNALPEAAAAEIRRVGANDRFVGVAMGGNALSRPFGHAIYHPIYEAASELGLPLVFQIDADASGDMIAPPVAGGLPSTSSEYRVLAWHAQMTHLASMVIGGVFDLFPALRIMLVGGGAVWVPGTLWRMDFWHRVIEREATGLARLPSEYFLDHFQISTYGLETPARPELLIRALEALPGIDRSLVYTSCYPNKDWQRPEELAARLPDNWHQSVFHDNADELFRWPSSAGVAYAQTSTSDAMET